MDEKEFEIIESMQKYGGSFVQALAVCFQRADSANFVRLKNAFPEYQKQYKEMSKK